jgi:hypothetical protein
VTSIVALGVQTVTRPVAAHAAAPLGAPPAREGDADPKGPVKNPAPAGPLLAEPALAALISLQAEGHADPQPDHGRDDEHGHKPPPEPPPPPVLPPPPVVTPPPVVQPPAPRPAPSADPAAPARAIAMVERALADGRAAEARRSAFTAAAAERRAAVTIAQGQAALAVLAVVQAQMDSFRAYRSA